MDEATRRSFTPDARDALFHRLQLNADQFADLGGFENIVLANEDVVVRITHASHRDRLALLGELEFVSYLADKQCAVARPLPVGDEVLISDGEWHVCLFQRAIGEPLPDNNWSPAVIKGWGEAIGRFHHVTRTFSPQFPRMTWREDENQNFDGRIPRDMMLVRAVAESVMTRLATFETAAVDYGLIHGDAHPGNFLVNGDRPVFFDFDDAIYAWFAYDVATILFSVVLRESVDQSDEGKAKAAEAFLRLFLEGYSQQAEITPFMAAEMQTFLKLRELSLFAVIHRFMDVDKLDEFPARFMQGRQQSIEEGRPVLDINFEALMT